MCTGGMLRAVLMLPLMFVRLDNVHMHIAARAQIDVRLHTELSRSLSCQQATLVNSQSWCGRAGGIDGPAQVMIPRCIKRTHQHPTSTCNILCCCLQSTMAMAVQPAGAGQGADLTWNGKLPRGGVWGGGLC
jgi:hypothetical protein